MKITQLLHFSMITWAE
jgi:hypothetical protein